MLHAFAVDKVGQRAAHLLTEQTGEIAAVDVQALRKGAQAQVGGQIILDQRDRPTHQRGIVLQGVIAYQQAVLVDHPPLQFNAALNGNQLLDFQGKLGGQTVNMQRVNAEDMPHMESMSCYLGSLDEQQGEMELTTYFLAGEGDVYLLSDEEFRRFAPGGVFRELEEEESLLTLLQGAEEDLQRGWMQYVNTTGESYGEEHLLGIPCSALPGMEKLVARPGEAWLCVLVNNGNDTNVMRFMEILVQDALEGPLVEINMEEEEK